MPLNSLSGDMLLREKFSIRLTACIYFWNIVKNICRQIKFSIDWCSTSYNLQIIFKQTLNLRNKNSYRYRYRSTIFDFIFADKFPRITKLDERRIFLPYANAADAKHLVLTYEQLNLLNKYTSEVTDSSYGYQTNCNRALSLWDRHMKSWKSNRAAYILSIYLTTTEKGSTTKFALWLRNFVHTSWHVPVMWTYEVFNKSLEDS